MSSKFGQMPPLVSMATDRVTVGKTFLIRFISYLQVMVIYIRAGMCSKFGEIGPWTTELAALMRLKKIPWTYNDYRTAGLRLCFRICKKPVFS